MNTTNISYFPNLLDPKNGSVVSLESILDEIKNPNAKIKDKIIKLRETSDPGEREEMKRKLPVVCFSGVFSERRESAIVKRSRLICLDFDKVECLEDLETALLMNEFILACWRSPSGTGIKALVKVSSDDHKAHALALLRDFPQADGNAMKDTCRATFMSWDENLYYYPEATTFFGVIHEKQTPSETYSNLKVWLARKGIDFIPGNRNAYVFKLASSCNRFGLDKEWLKTQIDFDFVSGTDFTRREMERTVDGAYDRYQSQFNSQSFESVSSTTQVDAIMEEVSAKPKDIILVNDIRSDMIKDYHEGSPGGETTYFPDLDKIFKFKRGEQTTLTGVSGAGKSAILIQLLVIKAALEDKKFGILSMEQYPPVHFYKEIVRTIMGKPVERDSLDRMTLEEYNRGMDWANDHFYYVYPSSADPTPEWTLGQFFEAITNYGVDGVVVDPYNSQSHDFESAGNRDDRYIAQMLRKNERFALQNDVFFFNVAHPRGIGKNKDGTYKEATADEISGGPTWWQCSSNILIHHRPKLPLDIHDTTCTLRSQKIKRQPANGRPGVVNFNYNWKTGRFTDEKGFNPLTKIVI